MNFLLREKGKNQRAHVWDGKDTACRMWSTGGLARSKKWLVTDSTLGLKICTMCKNKQAV